MNAVERVKKICKERKIAISKLESDLGFGNAYVSGLKKGVFPNDRLEKIAEYLNVSTNYLSKGEEKEKADYSAINAELADLILTDKKLSEALQVYAKLNSVQKDAIINMINSYKTNE